MNSETDSDEGYECEKKNLKKFPFLKKYSITI